MEDDFLAVRMVNEFVYCPRLFHYEAAEGIFVHNADTLEGKAAHKRVDTDKPAELPAAGEEVSENIHARSVSLFSEIMGLTGKLDLVEGEKDGEGRMVYSPVEYKKGVPREGDDGRTLWDADKVQLILQILLLRENGFPCVEGVVYYRGSRQRVLLRPTEEEETWARAKVAEARVVRDGPKPPPLDHSPKCPRCSLVGVCLPDETRLLLPPTPPGGTKSAQMELGMETLPDQTPLDPARIWADPFGDIPEIRFPTLSPGDDLRRLVAPNAETKALYLNTPGHFVGKSGDTLVVKEKDKKVGEFLLKDLHHVALFGPVQVSSAVVQTLCEEDIPLTYFSMGGWFYGITRGHSLKNVLIRIEQFRHAGDPSLALAPARLMVHGKIRNQRTLLLRNHQNPPKAVLKALKHLASRALHTENTGSLMGVEGTAAALYFGEFGGMLKGSETDEEGARIATPATFPFFPESRNRRPPRDPVNALLSLNYALLAKDCVLACLAAGFDPYVGFLHQPRHGRPALALDLMEEFRPLVADSTVLTVLNTGMLDQRHFAKAGEAVGLTPEGRKIALGAYERRLAANVTHPVFGYKISYRRALEIQARFLGRTLTGEAEQYVPFMTR